MAKHSNWLAVWINFANPGFVLLYQLMLVVGVGWFFSSSLLIVGSQPLQGVLLLASSLSSLPLFWFALRRTRSRIGFVFDAIAILLWLVSWIEAWATINYQLPWGAGSAVRLSRIQSVDSALDVLTRVSAISNPIQLTPIAGVWTGIENVLSFGVYAFIAFAFVKILRERSTVDQFGREHRFIMPQPSLSASMKAFRGTGRTWKHEEELAGIFVLAPAMFILVDFLMS